MSARIIDPETGAEKPLTRNRHAWDARARNIFTGYLDDPEKTRQALRDDWFVTGDLARFDEDGFLFIEGRLSRFSKIGGEMVPHGTLEQKSSRSSAGSRRKPRWFSSSGRPIPPKGEALVLLTTREITVEQLREKLRSAGLPALWVPRVIHRVEKIPMLGTGKTDLKGCQQLALEAGR